jgi:hypothetical protein
MERSTKAIEVSKIAENRREAPILQRRNHWLILTLNNDPLFIEHENVHVDPLTGHVERVLGRHDRFRGAENISALEYLRHFTDALRIDEQLTWRQRC